MPETPNKNTDPMSYRPDIDGLRAVAVLAVVGFHGFYSDFKGGFIGVDIFFVISGFLISTIVFTRLDDNSFSFLDFYARRIRRIFPALIIVLIFAVGYGWFVLYGAEYKQLGKHVAGGAGFISNFILWNESGYFDNVAESKPLLHLWSLGIEEQYYIFWPFLLWLAWRKNLKILTLILSLGALSFLINIIQVRTNPVAGFYSPLTRCWELFSGSALAYIMLYHGTTLAKLKTDLVNLCNLKLFKSRPEWDVRSIDNLLSILGASLITIALLVIRKEKLFPGFWALLPVLGAVFLIAAGPNAWVNRKVLSNRPMVWIGLISYPLYLWHWPIFSYIHIVEPNEKFQELNGTATMVSFALAWATFRWVEQPIRFGKWKKQAMGPLIMVMVLIGGAGLYSYHSNGFRFRPISKMSEKIISAKTDLAGWVTVLNDGKIENYKIYKGKVEEQVLFIGDSIMGQYYPRLVHVYSHKPLPHYSTLFVARNHCQPIPNFDLISGPENINCIDYYKAAMKLAEGSAVKKVVLAGNWIDLAPDNELGAQGKQLIQDIKHLVATGKEVVILLMHPRSGQFNPDNIIKPIRKNRTSKVKDFSVKREQIEIHDAPKNRALKNIARQSGATIIDPYDYLCPEGMCPVLIDGYALYLDGDHIRAKHAREHAVFMDEIVNTR